MKKVPPYKCDIAAEHTAKTCRHFLLNKSFPPVFLHFITFVPFYFNRSVFYLSNVGLKSMVEQGVRNPLVDLLSLEDKTLDEVGFNESLMSSWQQRARRVDFLFIWRILLQGYGANAAVPSASTSNRTVKESSNAAIIKRFNHHSAMVLAAGSQRM